MKKKKVVLIFILILAVTTGLAGYGFAENSAAPIEHQRITSSELPVITQEDVDNNYQDYASDEATYFFSQDTTGGNGKTVNNVGTVMDFKTDEPIPNAKLIFNERDPIVTDENGRYQIPDFPEGKYDCIIYADGYYKSSYLNMMIDDVGDTIISFFYVSKRAEFIEDHDEIKRQIAERERKAEAELYSQGNQMSST